MVKELRRKGVTLQLLWEEYLREHPDGYQNSQFCYHFHRWRQSAEVGMHIDHKAGEKLFVDYAGDRLAIVDADSGKEQPVETFVAILGASELTYVEASASQQSEDWIRSNERTLHYCGSWSQSARKRPGSANSARAPWNWRRSAAKCSCSAASI